MANRIRPEDLREQIDRTPARTVDTTGRHKIRPISEFPMDDDEDRLHIAKHMIPEGYDLQWVTDSVYGKQETQRRAKFERKGWVPVHQEDFSARFDGKWMKKGKEGEINYDGLVLMARPIEWSIKAREQDRRAAKEQVMIKERQLRGGDLPGVSAAFDTRHETALRSNYIRKEMERIEVPQD